MLRRASGGGRGEGRGLGRRRNRIRGLALGAGGAILWALPHDLAAQEAPPASGTPTRLYLGSSRTLAATEDELVWGVDGGFQIVHGDLELRADEAVLWLDKNRLARRLAADSAAGDALHQGPRVPAAPGRESLDEEPRGLTADVAAVLENLKEIYLAGHVVWRQSEGNVVLADRLYHNFREQRGIVSHCDLYAEHEDRGRRQLLRLHLTAEEVRAQGFRELEARDASVSTCTFGTPHYHVESERIDLVSTEAFAPIGTIDARGNRLEVGDVPVIPLPPFSAELQEGDSLPLKRVRVGHSSAFGTFVLTSWGDDVDEAGERLHDRLGIDAPFSGKADLDLDFLSRRGVGIGPGVSYQSPGLYWGEIGTYYIYDQADEDRSLLSMPEPGGQGDPLRYDIDPPSRGRAFTRDRFYLAENWRLDAEVHYLSDESFLNEYFEEEAKEEKEPESYGHLVYQEGTTRFRTLYRNRLNDFDTQLDSLPRIGYEQVGEPLVTLTDERAERPVTLVLSHGTEVANLRQQFADSLNTPGERLWRGDSMVELSLPFQAGPLGLRPFTSGELTGYQETVNDGPAVGRVIGTAGGRAELTVHRDFSAYSPLFRVDGLRHIALFDVSYLNRYAVSRDPAELVQLDDVDAQDLEEQFLVGVRQRLQTWRGDRVETFLFLDVELPLYPDEDRDNVVRTSSGSLAGRTAGPLRVDLAYRPGFTAPWLSDFTVLAEGEWNLADDRLDVGNFGLRSKLSERWYAAIGYRLARNPPRDTSRVLTGSLEARLSEKWAVAYLHQYDLASNQTSDQRLEVTRFGHDWLFQLTADRDRGENDTSVSISLRPIFFTRRPASPALEGRTDQPLLMDLPELEDPGVF